MIYAALALYAETQILLNIGWMNIISIPCPFIPVYMVYFIKLTRIQKRNYLQ